MKLDKDIYGVDIIAINNEDDFEIFADTYNDLMRRAGEIANTYLKIENIISVYNVDEDDICMDEQGDIIIKYQSGGRGYHEECTKILPAKYLFDPNWEEKAKETLAERERIEKKQQREKAEQERIRKAEEKDKRERETYLKLKAKYEGHSQ